MGGLVPLGYDLKDRALVINQPEAETVRTLFRLYRELGTVRRVKEEADRMGLVTKWRPQPSRDVAGGGPFTRGHLYQLLSNRIYAGEVTHKGTPYRGLHDAIIDRETFDAVQHQLAQNAAQRRSQINATAPSLLTGLVYDETGDLLCPTHANKKGTRYRYYVSKRLVHPSGSESGGWRLPAKELEAAVLQAMVCLLRDELQIAKVVRMDDAPPDWWRKVMGHAAALAVELLDGPAVRQRQLLMTLLDRVILQPTALSIAIKLAGLVPLVATQDTNAGERPFNLLIPIRLKRRGVEAKLVLQDSSAASLAPDPKLVSLLAQAQRWLDDLASGRAGSLRELASRYRQDVGEVSRTLPLAFLAPDIVEAVLGGGQPVDLTPRRLLRIGILPLRWEDQRRRLSFRV